MSSKISPDKKAGGSSLLNKKSKPNLKINKSPSKDKSILKKSSDSIDSINNSTDTIQTEEVDEETLRIQKEEKRKKDFEDSHTVLEFIFQNPRRIKTVTCDRFTNYFDLQTEIAKHTLGSRSLFNLQQNKEFIR